MDTQFTATHIDTIRQVACRVQTPNQTGSGVLLANSNYLLTAKHCLLGKTFADDFNPINLTVYVPLADSAFSVIQCNEQTPILYSTTNAELDLAIVVLPDEAVAQVPQVACLEAHYLQQPAIFRGYPKSDNEGQGVNIDVQFVDSNLITTQRSLETLFDDAHSNCDGFSGSGVFSVVNEHLVLVGLLYELKEPFRRFKIYNLTDINKLFIENEFPPLSTIVLPVDPTLLADARAIEVRSQRTIATIHDKFARQLHLDRKTVQESFATTFQANKLVILKGIAGVGKSAFAKHQLAMLAEQGYKVLAFKADWFATERIESVFPNLTHDLSELLSFLGRTQQLVILIDSLEKLLEVDTYFAFRDFLQICKAANNVRIVITCRNYAYQHLIFDLHYDFPSYSFVDVPLLSENELDEVATHFSLLSNITANQRLRNILKRPFYLNKAIQHSEIQQITEPLTEIEFRHLIWSNVIAKNSTARARVFEAVAIERATKMRLFVRLDNLDEQATHALVRDEILEVDDELGDAYRPSHDIYEDIALIRFIKRAFEERNSTPDFFQRIGGRMPAKRRGFRLWLNDALTEPERVSPLIQDVFVQSSIKQFWVDEVIISILRSLYCENFFESYEEQLLQNDQALLLRFIHLLRTSCQEPDEQLIKAVVEQDNSLYQLIYLRPVGNGWPVVIRFIDKHFDTMLAHRPLLLRLLTEDWSKKITNDLSKLPPETSHAGRILLKILDHAKWHFRSWRSDLYSEKEVKKGIETFLTLTSEFEDEARELISTASATRKRANKRYRMEERRFRATSEVAFDEDETAKQDNQLRGFHDAIIEFVLSGLGNQRLCLAIPDLVCEVAINKWLIDTDEPRRDYGSIMEGYIDFGLTRDNLNCSPSGIFKTPIRHLLYFHPQRALHLIVRVINHCTDAYRNSERGQNSNVVQVRMRLNDGSEVQQWGNAPLWGIFRGGSIEVTHYLLESILMSLEAWLLEWCQVESDTINHLLETTYTFFLKHSTSVATTAVLASVAQAYPHRIKENCFPILTVREFFAWDIRRMVGEDLSLAPMDMDISFAQKTRYESNQLLHRKNRLEFLVTKLQFEGYAEPINRIIDQHKKQCQRSDKDWRLALNRMDARNFVIDNTVTPPEPNQIVMRPQVSKELQAYSDERGKLFEPIQMGRQVTNWTIKIYQNEEQVASFEEWEQAFQAFKTLIEMDRERTDMLEDPTHLAAIGISRFSKSLSDEQMMWCIDTLISAIETRIPNKWSNSLYPIMSVKPAVETLPKVLCMKQVSNKTKLEVKEILFLGLLHLTRNRAEYSFEAFRNQAWKIEPAYANACLAGMIEYAKMLKKRKLFVPNSEEAKQERLAFLQNQIALAERVLKNDVQLDLSKLSFKTHSSSLITLATMIIPFDSEDSEHIELQRQVCLLHIKRSGESHQHRDSNNYSYQVQVDYQNHLGRQFLLQKTDVAAFLFREILDSINQGSIRDIGDSRGFVSDVLQWIISEQRKLNTASFWTLWSVLEKYVRGSEQKFFLSYLLLSHHYWISRPDSWVPLRNKSQVMQKRILEFGQYDVKAVMQLLSGIGTETLMPQGLNWLNKVIVQLENPRETFADSDVFVYSEKLIQRTYYRYLRQIKQDKQLQSSFLVLLNLMVDLGSSLAFIVRERLITL